MKILVIGMFIEPDLNVESDNILQCGTFSINSPNFVVFLQEIGIFQAFPEHLSAKCV